MPDRPHLPADILVIAAVVLCCALPALVVVAAGVIASGLGAAARLWPVFVAGSLLVGFGGRALVRRIRGRKLGAPEREESPK